MLANPRGPAQHWRTARRIASSLGLGLRRIRHVLKGSIHHLLPRALCRGRPWSWSWRLAKQTPRPSRACAHVERVAEVRKPMARASPASILPCAPCCRPTVNLNEAIDASMDGALKVFDEMDTRYAFISLPFNIWLC